MAVVVILLALVLFYLLGYYEGGTPRLGNFFKVFGKNKVADFIKEFSAKIPREYYEGSTVVGENLNWGNVVIKCSYDDLKVDINFIQTDASVEGPGMVGAWISFVCPFKTRRTFKISKNKKRTKLLVLASKFERECQIAADCDETKSRIASNPNLCEYAKKILGLFIEIDLSDDMLSAVSQNIEFRNSEPEALFSYLDSFVAFAKILKTDSYFVETS